MRKNDAKKIQEEVFVEAIGANTMTSNVAEIVKNNNKNNALSEMENSIDKERQMFEE